MTHYPRTAGEQTGANLGVILRAFRELFALRGEIRATEPRRAAKIVQDTPKQAAA